MKDLILRLASTPVPSGTEHAVQQQFLDLVSDVADEVYVDTLGNGIARKHGPGEHILLAAHADEPGVMVTHMDEAGFLRVMPVGNTKPEAWVGRHIQFTNGVIGVVGAEHHAASSQVTFDSLYVDIGAASVDEAKQRVRFGLEAVVLENVAELSDHILAGRALDNRVGCAIGIQAFREVAAEGRNISLVFTAQNAVGARGAQTAAFRLQPDRAIVIDAAPAGDMPMAPRMELKLGAGPALKVMDGSIITPARIKRWLEESADSIGIDIQYEVWPSGHSDAGALEATAGGIPIGGISYPARYVGHPSTVVDLRDAEAAVRWMVQAIRMTK